MEMKTGFSSRATGIGSADVSQSLVAEVNFNFGIFGLAFGIISAYLPLCLTNNVMDDTKITPFRGTATF